MGCSLWVFKLQKTNLYVSEKILPAECELIGAYIGDGHISTKHGKYIFGLTGHRVNDKGYFDFLSGLILNIWGKKVIPHFQSGGLRIKFDSKYVVHRLINDFGLAFNDSKCYAVKIPNFIASDWKLAKYTIRGIVDTDGSVFVADKPGSPKYPSIEITTTSKVLADQIWKILTARGFKVAKIWSYNSKLSIVPAYKVPLNGRKNLRKWVQEIGFSNPYKLNRAMNALA